MNHVVKCLFLLLTTKVFKAEINLLTPLSFIWGALSSWGLEVLGLPLLLSAGLKDPVSHGRSLGASEGPKVPWRPLFRWLYLCQMPAQVQVLSPCQVEPT